MPDEYISRAESLADFEACNAENPRWTPQRVKTLLLRQPAADVAEVVRCKYCRHLGAPLSASTAHFHLHLRKGTVCREH